MHDGDGIRCDTPADGVLRITLDRPESRNAIDTAMVAGLRTRLDEAAADDDVRVLVLAGAGGRAFSSGYDLDELRRLEADELTSVMAGHDQLLWRYATFPKPTIAALTGVSRGAGTLLAACSDMRVGDTRTDLAVTAARYGGANLTWVLGELIGAGPARDLLMTARSVRGAEALRMGLLSRLVDDGDVPGASVEIARELAQRPPEALREIKRLVLDGVGRDLRSRFEAEVLAARTTLRPRPVEEMFGDFFARHARGGDAPGFPAPGWDDPFVPTRTADDEFTRMVGALAEVQEALTRSLPTSAEAESVAERLSAIAGELRRREVSEDEQIAGKRWEVAGRGQALAPPLHLDEVSPTRARGHVTVGRFHSGRYAMNGGVTPLIFDEMLARLANGFGRAWGRTAYLKVDYRAPAPLDTELTVTAELVGEEGRKRYMRGAMYDGETLLAEAEGLWVQIRTEEAGAVPADGSAVRREGQVR